MISVPQVILASASLPLVAYGAFLIRDGDKIGESEYEGRVNVEKYLRSGVIEVNSTFYYKNIKGETWVPLKKGRAR